MRKTQMPPKTSSAPIPLEPRRTTLTRWAMLGGGMLLLLVSFWALQIDMGKFLSRLSNVPVILQKMMGLDIAYIPDILLAATSTLAVAFLALVLSVAIALLLSFFGARNISPHPALAAAVQGTLAFVRAVPTLIWGLLTVATLGFSSTTGLVSMMFPAVGFLTKSFCSTIEEKGGPVIEALRTTGAGRGAIFVHGILPLCLRLFVAWVAIQFESNLALSVSLGAVGVTGLGLLLTGATMRYQYTRITTIVLFIFVLLFTIEMLTGRLKKQLK